MTERGLVRRPAARPGHVRLRRPAALAGPAGRAAARPVVPAVAQRPRRDRATSQLPENEWVAAGEVVLSTDPAHPVGDQVTAGSGLALSARSLVLLRQL